MNISFKFTPDLKALIRRLGSDVKGGMRAGMLNLVEDIEARAVKKTPVRTSNLVNSITSFVTPDGMKGIIKTTDNAPYAKYVHFGTGIYGPLKKKIVPKTKKALYWPGAKHPVRSVKGQKPNPFLYNAAKEVNPQVLFEEGISNYLKRKGW